MKEEFPFRCVPVLELENGRRLGHELAILSYLARRCPKTSGGGDEEDWILQSQLQAACEDLYQKLVRFQSTKYVKRDLGKQEANCGFRGVGSEEGERSAGETTTQLTPLILPPTPQQGPPTTPRRTTQSSASQSIFETSRDC